jgi:hypothetical protein
MDVFSMITRLFRLYHAYMVESSLYGGIEITIQGQHRMKPSATKKNEATRVSDSSNNKEMVASGVRVRTALKAGLNFAKICYEYR